MLAYIKAIKTEPNYLDYWCLSIRKKLQIEHSYGAKLILKNHFFPLQINQINERLKFQIV